MDDHKYSRGHVLVVGGRSMTGAGRLAARAALRAGAGIVTVACPPEVTQAYVRDTAALICQGVEGADQLVNLIKDRKISAVVVGPGLGVEPNTTQMIEAILSTEVPTVLDADALTAFQKSPTDLWKMIKGPAVLTPHHGEFIRLFDIHGDRMARSRLAAKTAAAVVLFKGADTVVAAPNGRAIINTNASAWLATAGAGDVLAGIVGSLLGQRIEPFYAASAAVWMHGEAAAAFGPGLIADDLPDLLPIVLRSLAIKAV